MFEEYIENLSNNKEIFLKVKVLPGAGHNALLGVMPDKTLKIAIAAAPDKGKANQELIKFLAVNLAVRRYQVKIISGVGDRVKLIKVSR
jgi:uncharacterized protein (TIGR00251 family)